RSFDIGIEQGMAGGRGRIRLTYFDNDFHGLIEFVSNTVLPQLGIDPVVAAAVPFGATVNSQSFLSRVLEVTADPAVAYLRLGASYTYFDAEVTESFSGDALAPATNPAFPGVEIGAFSPLVGNRPFRRPTHSGTLFVSYVRGPAQLAISGY